MPDKPVLAHITSVFGDATDNHRGLLGPERVVVNLDRCARDIGAILMIASTVHVETVVLRAEGISIGGAILLKARLAPADEFSVMVHECAHEMLHQDPGNRPKEKTVREAEAEAVAYVVCQGVGLDVNTASSDYIQLYNGDKKTLTDSLERIQMAAGEILEAVTDEGLSVDAAGRLAAVAVAA